MCLLQGETKTKTTAKTISCYKVIFIFFAWNKLMLQSWHLGCSPWLTMWTRKSARESFSSDRWKINITTELIFWEMWSVIFRQTEKIHLPHPAELVMMSHEAGWARLYCLVCKNIYSLRGDQLTGTGNLERFLVKVKRILNQYKLWQPIKELVQTKTLPGLCWPEYKMKSKYKMHNICRHMPARLRKATRQQVKMICQVS